MKTITDGSAIFTVRDKRIQAMIDMFYPIGTVYMSADKSKTKADFPFMQYGTWEEISANLCLQTGNASEAGDQRSAGLPNITGTLPNNDDDYKKYYSGALYSTGRKIPDGYSDSGGVSGTVGAFDASLSNPIYGASNTVQPPAYMVRAWVRTA